MHQWSTTPLNNQTADSRANWQEGQPASSLNNSARGLMSTAAFWRDDNLGTLVATLGAGNVYTVTTGQGLIDPASTAGGGTAKISHAFTLRVVLPALNTAVATSAPTIVIDGAAAVPLRRRDGSALVDGDLTGLPYEILGDTITAGAYGRARILGTLPSNQPQIDLNAIYARIEARAAAIADDRRNNSVVSLRWVFAGQKGCTDQPGTGGFISPFGGQAMSCDYWTLSFTSAEGIYTGAPFAYRYRNLQMLIPNQGWVTVGAVS